MSDETPNVAAPDDVMTRIGRGIELNQRGEKARAHALFTDLWSQIGPDGDAVHRCALAHSMADTCDDPHEELRWDLEALRAADSVTDEHASAAGMAGPVAAFYPSLHLNLGEVHRKLGDLDAARRHLDLGGRAVSTLPDDDYGQMITAGLDALRQRLDSGEQPTS
ncbi:tetratricopeptide repeat protein [Kineococcus sp. T13]|uniref:tetratricopeptide repeat protein n=1 Tax=Kineococcus vitellinus TaxID=2696565 RepID=UPI0014135F20|nr:tetratricopeptide repeat protein [Kineococcus vitellinus]NAZ74330.1 tetratricopeptide repeat protein [Kineococcus vitellinus]